MTDDVVHHLITENCDDEGAYVRLVLACGEGVLTAVRKSDEPAEVTCPACLNPEEWQFIQAAITPEPRLCVFKTVNEIRAEEDMPLIEQGDIMLIDVTEDE